MFVLPLAYNALAARLEQASETEVWAVRQLPSGGAPCASPLAYPRKPRELASLVAGLAPSVSMCVAERIPGMPASPAYLLRVPVCFIRISASSAAPRLLSMRGRAGVRSDLTGSAAACVSLEQSSGETPLLGETMPARHLEAATRLLDDFLTHAPSMVGLFHRHTQGSGETTATDSNSAGAAAQDEGGAELISGVHLAEVWLRLAEAGEGEPAVSLMGLDTDPLGALNARNAEPAAHWSGLADEIIAIMQQVAMVAAASRVVPCRRNVDRSSEITPAWRERLERERAAGLVQPPTLSRAHRLARRRMGPEAAHSAAASQANMLEESGLIFHFQPGQDPLCLPLHRVPLLRGEARATYDRLLAERAMARSHRRQEEDPGTDNSAGKRLWGRVQSALGRQTPSHAPASAATAPVEVESIPAFFGGTRVDEAQLKDLEAEEAARIANSRAETSSRPPAGTHLQSEEQPVADSGIALQLRPRREGAPQPDAALQRVSFLGTVGPENIAASSSSQTASLGRLSDVALRADDEDRGPTNLRWLVQPFAPDTIVPNDFSVSAEVMLQEYAGTQWVLVMSRPACLSPTLTRVSRLFSRLTAGRSSIPAQDALNVLVRAGLVSGNAAGVIESSAMAIARADRRLSETLLATLLIKFKFAGGPPYTAAATGKMPKDCDSLRLLGFLMYLRALSNLLASAVAGSVPPEAPRIGKTATAEQVAMLQVPGGSVAELRGALSRLDWAVATLSEDEGKQADRARLINSIKADSRPPTRASASEAPPRRPSVASSLSDALRSLLNSGK